MFIIIIIIIHFARYFHMLSFQGGQKLSKGPAYRLLYTGKDENKEKTLFKMKQHLFQKLITHAF